jgi:hypothetical protein
MGRSTLALPLTRRRIKSLFGEYGIEEPQHVLRKQRVNRIATEGVARMDSWKTCVFEPLMSTFL